jgi:hypothetical protein
VSPTDVGIGLARAGQPGLISSTAPVADRRRLLRAKRPDAEDSTPEGALPGDAHRSAVSYRHPQVHRAVFAREGAVDDYSWIDDVGAVDLEELSNLYRIAPLGDKPPQALATVFGNSM